MTRDPSAPDRALTERLREALALVDVRLLDHVVVGAGVACSMEALRACEAQEAARKRRAARKARTKAAKTTLAGKLDPRDEDSGS